MVEGFRIFQCLGLLGFRGLGLRDFGLRDFGLRVVGFKADT